MASIVISDQDVALADTFLTAYLQDKIVDADFSEGSVLRDFVVKALAYIFAYLERERKITRDRQSLLSLGTLPAGESIDEAVAALLSNWFLTRKVGSTALLTAVLHFSQAVDVELQPGTRFFRTASSVFTPNILSTIVIPASELRPNVGANGLITDYTTSVTLLAAKSGNTGNAVPGRFASADPFSSFFLYAENLTKGDGGKDIETTTELLARAPTAISVRNLVNARSIDTVLREKFNIATVRSIGMEEPEMIRDLSTEAVSGLRMHVGGYADIYALLPRTDVLETLVLGNLYPRPDGLASILRDASQNFVTAGVLPGMVLRLNAGLPNAPREYIVIAVATTTLEVQPRMAFSKATDEESTFVTYTVGIFAPSFDNVIGNGVPVTTGQTSRRLAAPGRVILKGCPQYKVKSVEVVNLDLSVIVLGPRVNGPPALGEYQLITRVPANAQSAFTVTDLIVNVAHNTKNVRVRYESLVGWADIHNYVRDRFERIVTANPLVKGFHPVYVSMNLQFKLKASATATVSPAAVSVVVADYINAFDPFEIGELSGILEAIRAAFPNIGAILSPTILAYELLAPDGQVYAYTTQDLITIFPKSSNNAAQLTNGSALRAPLPDASLPILTTNQAAIDTANITLAEQLAALGVSDRTVRYLANASDVTVTEAP